MYDLDIRGMKFKRILRCSEDEQETESFPQQTMTTDACAERFGVIIVGEKRYAGHSATTGDHVVSMLELIEDKKDGADFDGFILDSYSRFSRSDADEARLYAECRDANLLVLTDKEGLMMGPGTWAKRGSATDQNEGYARDVGRHISRKMVELITKGLVPPTLCFPWGLDREYYDHHGTPIFRVRRLLDGRRVVMNPEEPHAIRFYIAASKQRLDLREDGHSFKWVPGDREILPLVQTLFRDHFIGGVNPNRLSMRLNRLGIPCIRGKRWSAQSVRCILNNPIWIGLSVGFVHACGSHCERTKTGVKMHAVSKRPGYRKDKKRRKRLQLVRKPALDWVIAEQPKLMNFLDDDVREVVRAQWNELVANGGKRVTKAGPKRRNLPTTSRYFLSKVLKIESDSYPMVGTDGPTRGDTCLRYYMTRREQHNRAEGDPHERVRADVVEGELLTIVKSVLSQCELHAPTITQFISAKKEELRGKIVDSSSLCTERDSLENWYRHTYSVAAVRGQAILRSEAQKVERRLEEIDLQLAEAGKTLPEYFQCSAESVIASLRKQFADLSQDLSSLSFDSLRMLATALFSKLTFDPKERIVRCEIALPAWALSTTAELTKHVGTVSSRGCKTSARTTNDSVVLERVECDLIKRNSRHPCLECRRQMAA